jgi:hypothetical protein
MLLFLNEFYLGIYSIFLIMPVCGRGCYSFNIRDLFSSRIHIDGEIIS